MSIFKDSDLKLKKTYNSTSKLEILTVTEAGKLLGKSKDQMKLYVDSIGLTKIKVDRNVTRYLLLKVEIDNLYTTMKKTANQG